jgi:hypothetical protein
MQVRTILILGIVVREVFSFWTGHPFDFEVWVRAGYWVPRGVSPYSAMPFAPGVTFSNVFGGFENNAAIGYLPFWPLLVAAIYELWLGIGSGDRFVYYFMLKQPIILADVLLGVLLFLYVSQRNPDFARKVLVLWIFSPFLIIVSSIWGTFDSMAMAFVMLALLASSARTRAIWEGIGILAKSIPVLYILPLSYSRKSWPLNFLLALGIPVLFTLAVVTLTGWPNGETCFLTECPTQTVFTTLADTLAKSGFPLSLWGTWVFLRIENIISESLFDSVFRLGGYIWIPAVAIASLLARRWFGFATERGLVQSLLVITLTFLLIRGQVNEQYSIYLLALLLIDVALWSPKRIRLFYVVSAVVIAATLTNNFLLIRFLSPVFPGALDLERQIIYSTGQLRNFALYFEGLAFSGLNIWYISALIKERRQRGAGLEPA